MDFVSGKSQELVWSKVWDFQNEHFLLIPGFIPPDRSDDDLYFVRVFPWESAEEYVSMAQG